MSGCATAMPSSSTSITPSGPGGANAAARVCLPGHEANGA
jgi:hypothetical protein